MHSVAEKTLAKNKDLIISVIFNPVSLLAMISALINAKKGMEEDVPMLLENGAREYDIEVSLAIYTEIIDHLETALAVLGPPFLPSALYTDSEDFWTIEETAIKVAIMSDYIATLDQEQEYTFEAPFLSFYMIIVGLRWVQLHLKHRMSVPHDHSGLTIVTSLLEGLYETMNEISPELVTLLKAD